MTARHKLNIAYFNGCLFVSALFGLGAQSWAVFWVALAVTALSNRMFTSPIDPKEDRISSLKDDEWNRKLLEILGEGRLEDVAHAAVYLASDESEWVTGSNLVVDGGNTARSFAG